MPQRISILPLPDSTSILQGYYPISPCTVRGIIRIAHLSPSTSLTRPRPLRIQSLTVALSGTAWCVFANVNDALDMTTREQVILYKPVDLLTEVEEVDIGKVLEIPFEIPFPPDPDLDDYPPIVGTTPSPNLLPPSFTFMGQASSSLNSYQARITYEVMAILTEVPTPTLGLFPSRPPTHTCTLSLHPFKVYDPRLLPTLLHPDIRRWRSAPGAVPVEYDVEVGSIAMGPNDPLRFAYRIVVADESARKGVRLKRIILSLKEWHIVGERRCIGREDNPSDTSERKGSRIKGSIELLRWEQSEELPNPTDEEFELSFLNPKSLPSYSSSSSLSSEKHPLPRPGMRTLGGDGLSTESETLLFIPSLGGFTPTTPKPSHLPTPKVPPSNIAPPHIETHHTLTITIEFIGADKLVMESGCVLASVGKADVNALVDEVPECVPPLEYEKVVGGVGWVPEYSERDEVSEVVRKMGKEEWGVVKAVLEAEGVFVGNRNGDIDEEEQSLGFGEGVHVDEDSTDLSFDGTRPVTDISPVPFSSTANLQSYSAFDEDGTIPGETSSLSVSND